MFVFPALTFRNINIQLGSLVYMCVCVFFFLKGKIIKDILPIEREREVNHPINHKNGFRLYTYNVDN